MNRRICLLGLLGFVAAACTPKPAPGPGGSASATNPDPTTSASTPAAPPAKPTTATAPTEEGESADTWFVVSGDGVELGVIELRAGKPPKLEIVTDGEAAQALQTRLKAVGGPDGIALEMHLPPPSGKGRGPLGARIVKYDDKLYRHALKQELEPKYSVKEVLALIDPLPPPTVKKLHVSRSGDKVGSVDFGGTPPKVTLHTKKSDGDFLKSHMERVVELGALKFRYHRQPAGGTDTLVVAQANPGDAHYAHTVVLYLMVENSYRKRYAYELSFD